MHKKALDFLRFPSNRSVGNCRKDAKRLADQTGRPLHQCLHDVAVANGVPDGWDAAMKLLVERAMRCHGDLPAEMSQDDLIAISRRVPKLTQYGLGLRAELALIRPDFDYRAELERERELLLTTLDQCNLALRYVRHLRPQRRINANPAYSSYALKHAAERYLQRLSPDSAAYVSHGAFICAALFAGFLFERQSRDSLSAVFNVSDQSPIFEWERLLQSDSHDTEARRIALERQLGIEPVGAAGPDNGTGVRH